MRARGGTAAAVLALFVSAASIGCSKSEQPEKRIVMAGRIEQGAAHVPSQDVDAAPPEEQPLSERLPPLDTATASAPTTPPPPAPVATADAARPEDPDAPILARARVDASRCLATAPVTTSARSAKLTVTVIPTGSVSRADVTSSDTTEADVLACIKSVGAGLRFADLTVKQPGLAVPAGSLRTYAIDVMVTSGER